MATIIKKGLIGEQDQYNYDGVSTTFTRETSTGSTITLLKEGYEVDVLVVYGGCESYNSTTINSALTAIGTTNKVAIVLRPGTWTMNASITIPSNVTLKIPLGAVITTTGYTLTFNGGLEAGYYQIFTGTGTVSGLSTSIPEWWGAVADGSTDCYAAIQAAINCALSGTYGGEVILSPGWYMVKTTGLSVVNGTNKAFWMHGAGQHSTVILTPGTGLDGAIASGNLITWTSTGYPTSISDMTLSVSGSGNLNIDLLDIDTSDGVTVNNLWLSAAYCGLHVSDGSSNIRISNIQTEYNTLNYHIEASYMITMSNYHSHRAGLAGVYITGTDTAIAGLYSGGIVLNGGSLVQDGYGGGGSGGAIVINSLIPVSINGVEISNESLAAPSAWPWRGIYVVNGNVTVDGALISRSKIAGIQADAGYLTVRGSKIRAIGYYDQTTPWATYGVWAKANVVTLIVGDTTINSEGNGLVTLAANTQLNDLYFENCSNGGSTGSVNATSGIYAIYYDPQSYQSHFKLSGSHFYNASGIGKTGIYISDTAVPAMGNVKIARNNITLSSFQTPFGSALTNAQLLTYELSDNTGLLKTEASGSSAIVSGATSVVVPHTLGLTPLEEHILIIGKNNPTNSTGNVWIDTITSTTFTVNVENNPGTTGYSFGWHAMITPTEGTTATLPSAGGTTPTATAVDNFNRDNESPLTGTTWEPINPWFDDSDHLLQVVSNTCKGVDAAAWNAQIYEDVTASDIEAGVTISTLPAVGESVSIFLRMPLANHYGYEAQLTMTSATTFEVRLYKWAPVRMLTLLASPVAAGTITAGDIFLAQMVDSDLKAWIYRSAAWETIAEATDATYATANYAGLAVYGTTAVLDDFSVLSLDP